MAIMYLCSDGTKVSQSTIDRKYSESIKHKHLGNALRYCEACGKQAEHNDHTISRKRCKELHKTELIWNLYNFVCSCAKCHHEWESYKSGDWIDHQNMEQRLRFLKEHDPEGYIKRIELTKINLQHED